VSAAGNYHENTTLTLNTGGGGGGGGVKSTAAGIIYQLYICAFEVFTARSDTRTADEGPSRHRIRYILSSSLK
jgi:hypothetical protein